MTCSSNKYYLFFLLVALVIASSQPFPVYAQDQPPRPDLSNINTKVSATALPYIHVEKVEAAADENNLITGTFTAISAEEKAMVTDVIYELLIIDRGAVVQQEEEVVPQTFVYDRHTFNEPFSIGPNERKNIPFTYQAPPLPPKEYTLEIQLKTSTGRSLGNEETQLFLKGAEALLTISSSTIAVSSVDPITKEQEELWDPGEGVNVGLGSSLELRAQVVWTGGSDLAAIPVISTTRDLAENQKTNTTRYDPVTFQAGQQQPFSLPVTAEKNPGAYEVFLSFEQGGKRISSIAEYRYVVKGISASLIGHRIESMPTREGQEAVIGFSIAGSADRETATKGTATFEILEGTTLVGSQKLDIDFNDPSMLEGVAHIVLLKDICTDPTLRIRIVAQDGAQLDSFESTVDVQPQCDGQQGLTTGKGISKTIISTLLIVVLVILGGTVVLVLLKRKKKRSSDIDSPLSGSSTYILISLIGIGVAVYAILPTALAQYSTKIIDFGGGHVQVQKSCGEGCYITVFVDRPRHNETFPSATFPYEARFAYAGCENAPTMSNFGLFVPEGGGHVGPEYTGNWQRVQLQNASFTRMGGGTVGCIRLGDMKDGVPVCTPLTEQRAADVFYEKLCQTREIYNQVMQGCCYMMFPQAQGYACNYAGRQCQQAINTVCSTYQGNPFAYLVLPNYGGRINSVRGTITHPLPLPAKSTLLTYLKGDHIDLGDLETWDYLWINFLRPSISATPSTSPIPSTSPRPSSSITPPPGPTPSPASSPGATLTPSPSITLGSSPLVSPTPSPIPECSDGRDNDGDGKIDCTPGNSDPGCYTDRSNPATCNPNDTSESDVPPIRPGGVGETD